MMKMKGMIRWMASHHFTVNFMHFARHAPKGRVATKVMDKRVARNRGLCEEKSMREYVAEGSGMVKSAAAMAWHRYGGVGEYGKKGVRVIV